jgi:uncharacterized membrane protein YecN with MAPEG domain
MNPIYWIWLTLSIFVAHKLTEWLGLEDYAMKEKTIGYVILFFVYMVVLIFFDIIWNVVV